MPSPSNDGKHEGSAMMANTKKTMQVECNLSASGKVQKCRMRGQGNMNGDCCQQRIEMMCNLME